MAPSTRTKRTCPQGLTKSKDSRLAEPRAPHDLVRAVAELIDPVDRFEQAERLIDDLQRLTQELQAIRAAAASDLHAQGLTYREIGERLGLSPQRVAQLVKSPDGLLRLQQVWTELDRKLSLLGAYAEVATDRRSPTRLISALREEGVLTEEQFTVASSILRTRNEAVHARRSVPNEEVDALLDLAIPLSAQLELAVESARSTYEAAASEDRREAEALLRRVARDYPEIHWREGRCDQCGRAIPVEDQTELWVCTRECRKRWMRKLYQFIDPDSEEEAMTRTPKVVPYWI
jgi:predicted transcriptional regulator